MSITPQRIEYAPPYKPSWVDRLSGWVRQLPVPAWIFFLALGLILTLAAWLVLWTSGVRETRLYLLYALTGMNEAYLIALIHYLDQSAEAALARFRPVTTVDDAGYEMLRYRLTTLPARAAIIASTLGAIYAVSTLWINAITGVNTGRETLPASVIGLYLGDSLLLSILAGLLAYHTIHQLRTVSLIYTKHTRINLFQLGPLYALSNLAARTAIGISIPTYLWFWLNSSAPSGLSLSDLLPSVFFAAMVIVTFVWPLWGAHRLLEREKQRLLDEVAQRIETTITVFHSRIDGGILDENRKALRDTLDGLVIEQSAVQKLRTWPWRTETASSVLVAFLLPIAIWIIQRLLTRFGL